MNDSKRFGAAYSAIVITAIGGVLLTACGGASGGKVSGDLDDVKYLHSVRAVPARTHVETKHKKKTRRSCTGTGTGTGKKKHCSNVFDGYKTVHVTVTDKPGKPGQSAMYCVELDNVNGKKSNDDQWYAVSWQTYSKWENEDEGAKVKKMAYLRSLHKCKR